MNYVKFAKTKINISSHFGLPIDCDILDRNKLCIELMITGFAQHSDIETDFFS